MDAATGCPDDYAELFENYFPMMIGVVSRSHIQPSDVEDVAMDILARFIEKGGIDYYDPDRLHDVGESPEVPGARMRKARFGSMLRGFTATYVMQYRDKQMIKHRREPWRLDAPLSDDPRSMTFEEVIGDANASEVMILDVEVSTTIVGALKRARVTLSRKSTGHRDYDRFLDLCVEHGLLDGHIDRKRISEELGISVTTVSAMLKDLRAILSPLLSEAGVAGAA